LELSCTGSVGQLELSCTGVGQSDWSCAVVGLLEWSCTEGLW
jgi:hypothetical protein